MAHVKDVHSLTAFVIFITPPTRPPPISGIILNYYRNRMINDVNQLNGHPTERPKGVT